MEENNSVSNEKNAVEISPDTGLIETRGSDVVKEQILNFEEEVGQDNTNAFVRQIIGCTGSLVIPTCNGMILGFSAILFPQLAEENSRIKISSSEAAWIASMAPLQMASGCLVGGWTMERFGRKPVNLASTCLLILGWLFIAFASSGNHILAGRFISGLSIGFIGPCCTCYLGEITDPRYRGIFLSGLTLGIATGLFIVHLLGTYLDWTTVAMISACIPIVAIITYAVLPESYVWLLKKGRISEAKKSFRWFRGYTVEANYEIEAALKQRKHQQNDDRRLKDVLEDCCKFTFIKPFMVLNTFFAFSQFCGNNAVSFYSVSIMQSTVPSLDKYSAMLIVDTVRLVMSLIACILTKRYRIRLLAIISGVGTASSLLFLAVFSYLSEGFPDNRLYSTVPIVGFISYIIFLSVGFAPLPWLICGELLPPATKGIGSGISTSVNFISMFLVVKTNPDLFETCGLAGTYGIYSALTFLGTTILYFSLPETKGKTLQDIQKLFAKK